MMRSHVDEAMRAAILAAGVTFLLACGQAEQPSEAGSLEEVAEALRERGEEIGRGFVQRADELREEIEQARRAIEGVLEGEPGASREIARQARERAERALEQGTELLRRVAREREGSADDWVRHLQDGMSRLEHALDDLTTRTGREHADS